MSFELEGTLHKLFDTEVKGSSGFRSRDFVVQTSGEYPQFIKFQAVQDRCDTINALQEGDVVKVYFDLRGREWEGKYFTNLQAWRVEKVGAGQSVPEPKEIEGLPF